MSDRAGGRTHAERSAHQDARGDQRLWRRRQRAQHRGHAEARHPTQEDLLAAEPVGHAAAQQQQPREGHEEGVEHPLQLADARVEVLRDRRQGDVDDRHVDSADEHCPAQHGEATVARTHGLYPPISSRGRAESHTHGPARGGQGNPGRPPGRRLRPALLRHRRHPPRRGRGGVRPGQGGQGLHGRGRPRARRADLPRDHGAAGLRRGRGRLPAGRVSPHDRPGRHPPGGARQPRTAAHRRAPDRAGGRRGGAPPVGTADLQEERPRLPPGVRPAEEPRRLRPGRLPADPARRRQGGDGPQAAGRLPRADRAAHRVLRREGPAAPLRRQAHTRTT